MSRSNPKRRRKKPSPSVDEPSTDSKPKADANLLRNVLPNAVLSARGMLYLVHIRNFYPHTISADEVDGLYRQLQGWLTGAVDACQLNDILSVFNCDDASGDLLSEDQLSVAEEGLLLLHPDLVVDVTKAPPFNPEQKSAVFADCCKKAAKPIRDLVEPIQEIILEHCRIPSLPNDVSFHHPQRFIRLLRDYWNLFLQIFRDDENRIFGFRPHPLSSLIVNLQIRMNECFDMLTDCDALCVRDDVSSLFELLMDGDINAISVCMEDDPGIVGRIGQSLENARLQQGAFAFSYTLAEEIFFKWARNEIDRYKESMNREEAKYRRHELKQLRKRDFSVATENSDLPSTETQEPETTDEFQGEMIFWQDRVELRGVDICSGKRAGTRRALLELLAKRHADGSFIAYSVEKLENRMRELGHPQTATGLIRGLRKAIQKAGLSKDGKDAILSGGPGYRLAGSITTRSVDEPKIGDISDTDEFRNVPDVPDKPSNNPSDSGPMKRRSWILEQLEKGEKLNAPSVERHFGCSVKTAQRDFSELTNEGKVEFVGEKGTGHYRLCGRVVSE